MSFSNNKRSCGASFTRIIPLRLSAFLAILTWLTPGAVSFL